MKKKPTGNCKRLTGRWAPRGRVANILKAHSLNPAAMRAHLALYRELMFGRSELSRAERELIAVAVSVVNHCHY